MRKKNQWLSSAQNSGFRRPRHKAEELVSASKMPGKQIVDLGLGLWQYAMESTLVNKNLRVIKFNGQKIIEAIRTRIRPRTRHRLRTIVGLRTITRVRTFTQK